MSEENPIDFPTPASLPTEVPAAATASGMHPQVLSYEAPIDRLARNPKHNKIAIWLIALLGAVLGTGFAIVIGVVVIVGVGGIDTPAGVENERKFHFMGAAALAVAAFSGLTVRQWIKEPESRTLSDFLFPGFWIGVCVTSLVLSVLLAVG